MTNKGGERERHTLRVVMIAPCQNAVLGCISHASFLKKTYFLLRSKENVFVLT